MANLAVFLEKIRIFCLQWIEKRLVLQNETQKVQNFGELGEFDIHIQQISILEMKEAENFPLTPF